MIVSLFPVNAIWVNSYKTIPINEKTGRVVGYQAVVAAFEQMQAEVQHG
ncbi:MULTISPECIES: hypothetical protein [Aeromonas]|nr:MULTISPECIES: hypothetical protein [Aeromonas]BBG91648.1 hypothetical protein ACGSH8M1_p11030 [Aeromonas caviae]BBT55238.1 hypothetical protein WP8S18C01_P10580 [Aeromonas caviae]BBT97439.1 hypothetical protein WP8W19C03_P10860 [Aeromonas veronii]